ncbi:MAG TPA: hypothetical protein VG893_00055 [Terracidiphilus sp.]|nr:hypothetical protein [Terracidiphilus sp.]
MTQTLRPMTLGEIVDRTFQIYRSRFVTFVTIALVPALTLFAISLSANIWLIYHPLHGRIIIYYKTLSALLWTLAIWLIGGFTHLFVRPAFVTVTAGWIGGAKRSSYDCWSAIKRTWKQVLALDLFEQAVVILFPGMIFILGALAISAMWHGLGHSDGEYAILALAIFGLTGISLILYVAIGLTISLSFPALVLEESRWVDALKRSWSLVRGVRWRLFFLWVSVFVAGWTIQIALRWGIYFLVSIAHLRGMLQIHGGFGLSFSLYYFVNALFTAIVGPIYPIALTLIYYDQRIRREGYDIEWMMRVAGLNSSEAMPAGDAVTAASAGGEGAAL